MPIDRTRPAPRQSLELDADHNPKTRTLQSIARVLGVRPPELLDGSPPAAEKVPA